MPRALLYILVPLLLVAAVVGGYFVLSTAPPKPNQEPKPAPGEPPGPPTPAPATQLPKLVVLVVFDQMRGDYMSRWAELYGPDGFERMKKEGIWFSECYVPYACTSTGPGHASLSTGAPPSVHGIVENEWFDRKLGSRVYCCQPSRPFDLIPPVPAELGKPSRGSGSGYSPERFLAQTVGESLQEATKGKGRVFSLSIKDRTAVLMGGQKPNGVYCFDTRDGQFHTGAFYGRDAAHAWVTEFNSTKPADAWFTEKWEKLKPDIDYAKFSGPDDVEAEAPGVNGQGRTFPHPFKGKLDAPAKPYYDAVELSPAGNELLFGLVKKCVTGEKLGRGDASDLLCVSFSSTDIVGHFFGPDSQEVMDITLRADKLVGELLHFLDTEVGKDRYTLVLAADHGVCPLPELASSKQKYPAAARVLTSPKNEVLDGLEAALTAMYGATGDAPTRWLKARDADANEVWPWVYLDYDAIEARKLKVEDVAGAARDWLAGRGYVETAFTRKELEDKAAPDQPFKRAAVLAYRADRCGDVLVIPKAGVLITPYKGGTSHSTPHPYDAHIPFFVYGAGVPALGQRKEKVSSLSVAPTLAWALGVPAPKHAAVLPPEALPVKK
jgi:hypothetical protein